MNIPRTSQTQSSRFPTLGTKKTPFSKHWKVFGRFFQGLEKFLILMVVIMAYGSMVSSSVAGDIWLHMLTPSANVSGTRFLGDTFNGGSTWNLQFEVGQTSWDTTEAGIGPSNSDPADSEWVWATANWYADGSGDNKQVQTDIGSVRLTSTGTWYFNGRAKGASGDSFHYANDTTWDHSGTFSPSYSFSVTALNTPTSQAAARNSTNPDTSIDLSWTRGTSGVDKNTIILRKTSVISTAPTQGTSYSVNDTIDGATVIYNNSGTSFTDTSLSSGTRYYYAFYAENYSYYSTAVTTDRYTCPAAPTSPSGTDSLTDKITLTWTKSTGATGYNIYRNTSDSQPGTATFTVGDVATYDDTTASVGSYYYWIEGTNSSGAGPATSSFTGERVSAATPTITVAAGTLAFGDLYVGLTSSESSYTVSGSDLTADITVTAPSGFEVSTSSGSGFGSSVTLTQSGGSVASTTIYVHFVPSSATAYSDNITHTSTGATTKNKAVTGTGYARPTDVTWDGGGADSNLKTDANWTVATYGEAYPDAGTSTILRFAGTTRTSPVNDFAAGSDFSSIYFNTGAGSFTLSGAAFDLFSLIENDDDSLQTVNNNITMGAASSFDASSGDLTLGGTVTNGGFRVTALGANDVTFSSAISGTGDLLKQEAGTLVLAADNSFTGPSYLVGGTTAVSGADPFDGAIYLGETSGSDAATLSIDDASTVVDTTLTIRGGSSGIKKIAATESGTVSGGLVLSETTNDLVVVDVSASKTLTLSGVISGSGGGEITKTGSGALYMSNAANTHDKKITVTAGSLQVTASNNLGEDPGGPYVNKLTLDGGVLDVNASFTLNANNSITLGASGGEIDLAGGDLTFAGAFSGAGNLTKSGSQTLNVRGSTTSDFTGDWIITGGDIQFTNNANLGSANNDIQLNGGTLYMQNVVSGANPVVLNSGRTITLGASDGEIQVYGADTLSFAGLITGAGALTKVGGGTLLLTGANDYSGGTTVAGGTLKGDTTGLQGAIQVNSSHDLEFAQSGDGTYAGALSGAGDVTKSGTGNVTFSATSTLSGSTTVSEGTLTLTGSLASSALSVSSGATLAGTGTAGNVTVAGDIAPGSAGIGELTTSDLTLNNGATFLVQLGDCSGNTDRDFIDMNGTATINATVTVELDSSLVSNFDSGSSETWVIIEGGISSAANFSLDDTTSWTDSGGTALNGGTFSLAANGGNLELTFSPLADPPTLNTPTKTTVTTTTATLGATLQSNGGDSVTDYGIVWNTATAPEITDNKVQKDTTEPSLPSTFTVAVTGLPVGTHIYYRGYGINVNGTGYSAEDSFYTLSTEPVAQVTSLSADIYTGTGSTQLELQWTELASADGYIILRSTTASPTGVPVDGTGYSATDVLGNGTVAAVIGAGTTTNFNDTGLTADTQYYYAIFPFGYDGANAGTYNYKTDGTVATDDTYTLASGPTGAATIDSDSSTYSSITVNWTKGADSTDTLVIVSDGAIGSSPTDRNSYTANTVYGAGTEIGTDEFVAYAGSAATVTITGLNVGTTYYVKLFPYNGSDPVSYNYRTTSPASGTVDTTSRPTEATWDSGGTDDNMMTSTNWDNDVYPAAGATSILNFGTGSRTTPNNDYAAGTTFGTIDFNASSPAFTLDGNAMDLAIKIANNSANDQTVDLDVDIVATTDLEVDASTDDIVLGGVLSGAGKGLIKSGSKNLKLEGTSTYSGDTSLDDGELWFEEGAAVGGGNITVGDSAAVATTTKLWINDTDGGTTVDEDLVSDTGNSGTRVIGGLNSSGVNTFSGTLTLTADRTDLQALTAGGTVDFAGIISGASKDVVTFGPGTVRLSANNAFSGDLYAIYGTTEVTSTDPLDAATLYLGDDAATAYDATLALGSSSVSLDTPIIVRSGSSGTKTIAATQGSGVATLTGNIDLEDNLTLTANSGGDLEISGQIDMSYSGETNITVSGANDVELSGTILADNGLASITHSGSGTLLISGDNETGDDVNMTMYYLTGGGTLQFANAESFGELTPAVASYNDKVNFTGSGGSIYVTNDIDLNSKYGFTIADGVTASFLVGDASADDLTINGIVSDAADNGQVIKNGPGVLYLLGVNTFGGALTINNGTVRVTADSGLGSAPASETDGLLTLNGGTLLCASTFTLDANRNIALGASGGTLSAMSSHVLTIGSKIKGSGDLIVSGSGDVELSGVNTFNGTTTISDGGANGDLKVAADSAFGADPGTPTVGSITLNGGSLQATSTFELDSDRGIAIGASDGTIKVDSSQTLTYAGIISGVGNALTKAGAGTLLLTGANTYSGGTTVSAGTLQGDTTGLQGNIVNNAAVVFNQAGDGTYSGDMSGTGSLTKSGTGAVTLSGTLSYSGGTTVSGGTLFYNADNANSDVTVSSGIFGGNGTVGTLAVSGRVHPGSADDTIGELDCSALTLNAGGSYRWEISDVDAGAGTGHDFINVDSGSGTINADATSGNPFTIYVTGNPADWDGSVDYTWVIAQGATVNGHNADEFAFDFSGFTPSESDGSWSVAVVSGDLVINYVALATQPTTQATSLEITAVDTTTMSLAWSRGNGDKVLIVGRESSAAEDPSDAATYTANAAWGTADTVGTTSKALYQNTGTSENLTGLTAETLYHFAAYEFSGTGGAENYLLTGAPVISGYTLSTEPAGHAGSFAAGNPTASSIDLSWTAATGPLDGYMILKREGTDPTSTPTDGQAYSVGNTLSDGSVVAALVSGTSQTISSLTAATEYHFSIIPYNWDEANAGTYNYYTAATIPTANDTTESLTIIKDQFDSADSGYSVDASLSGLNGGTGWSGAWSVTTGGDTGSKVVKIVSSSKTVPDGYPENTGNKIQMSPSSATNDTFKAARSFTAFTSGKIYAAGLLSFAANGTDRYIGLSLMDGSTEKAFLGAAQGEGEVLTLDSYSANGDPINSSKVFYGNNDKSYLIIVRYDFSTEELSSSIYWAGVDTVPSQEPATWDLDDIDISGRIGTNGIDGIQITAGGIGTSFQFDEIRVADSWGALLGQSSSPGDLAPTVQASDLLFSAVKTNAFTINMTGGNGVGTLVVAREGAAVAWTPTDAATYTASAVFGSGQDLGNNTYVIYNGTDDNPNINLSNLSADTVYYIQAFEYNSASGTKYLTSEVSGNPANQSTLGAPDPAVGLSGTTAVDLSWTRFNDGNQDHNVLVAYRANSAVTFTPTDGVDYSTGAQGSDTILLADSSDTYYNHTGLTEDDTMYYRFFTRNGNYYSAGVDVQVTLTETTLTVYDGFEKSSGDLDQSGAGGTGWSGDWSLNNSAFADFESSSLSVLSSAESQYNKGLFYGDVDGRFIDATRTLSSAINSGTIYLSWIQQHQYSGSQNYAGLRILNSSDSVEAFIGKRYSDSLQIAEYGDSKSSSTTLDTGENYLIVAKIQFNASGTDDIIQVAAYKNNSKLLGEEPAEWALSVTTQVDNVDKIRLSCGANSGNQIGYVRYDEIRIGDSWTEVARYEGQRYKQMLEAGPRPELIFVGDEYSPSSSPLKNSITDAELNNSSAAIDIAVRWSSAQGVFMTNATTSLNSESSTPPGTLSTSGNVVPNWDPLTRNGNGDTALGFDKAFTGFVGDNGDLVVTSYYADAFTGGDFTDWVVGDEFFVSVSGQTLPSSGSTVSAPSGGDNVPDRRAFTINSNLAFQVVDDDVAAPQVQGFDQVAHTDEEMLAGLTLSGQVLDSGSGVDVSSLMFTLKNGDDEDVGSPDTAFTTLPASDGDAKTNWASLGYTIGVVAKADNSLGTWSLNVRADDVDDDGWVGDASSDTNSFTFAVTDDDSLEPSVLAAKIEAIGVILDDDFEDGDLADWTEGTASDWAVSTVSPINGSVSLKHNLSGVEDESYITAQPSYTLANGTVTWQFQLRNGDWAPTTGNNFEIYLMSDGADLTGSVNGYAVQMDGSNIRLRRITAGSPAGSAIIDSGLAWGSNNTRGLRVTRASDGTWTLYIDTDGGFDNLVSYGTGSDTAYTDTTYFGVFFDFTSTRAGELYVDDVSIVQTGNITDGDLVNGVTFSARAADAYSGLYGIDASGGVAPSISISNAAGTEVASDTFTSSGPSSGAGTSPSDFSESVTVSSANLGAGDMGDTFTAAVTISDYDDDRDSDSTAKTQPISFTVIDDDTVAPTFTTLTVDSDDEVTDGQLVAGGWGISLVANDVDSGLRAGDGTAAQSPNYDILNNANAVVVENEVFANYASLTGTANTDETLTDDSAPAVASASIDLGTYTVRATAQDDDNDWNGDRTTQTDYDNSGSYTFSVVDDDTVGPVMKDVVVHSGSAETLLSTDFEAVSDGGEWPEYIAESAGWTQAVGSVVYSSGGGYKNETKANSGVGKFGMNTAGDFLVLPAVSDPGRVTFYAKLSSAGSHSVRIERLDGASWTTAAVAQTVDNTDYAQFSFVLDDPSGVTTMRIYAVSAGSPSVYIDDLEILSQQQWSNDENVQVSWGVSTDNSGISHYEHVSFGGSAPSTIGGGTTTTGTNVTYANVAEGVVTGYLFAVDADADRSGSEDRSKGANAAFVAKIDRTAPPTPSGTPTAAEGPDNTSEIQLSWNTVADAGERAGDGQTLSPWYSYKVYYSTDSTIETNSDPFITVADGPGSLGTRTVGSAILSNFVFGETYYLAVAGVDEAGNEGEPSTPSAGVQLAAFLVTQGVAEVSAIVPDPDAARLAWTASVDGEGNVNRDYDVLYVDAANFSDSLSNQWALLETVQTNILTDAGQNSGTKPGQMAEHDMRFYRAALKGRWTNGLDRRVASEEVYVMQNIVLREGQNWVSLAGIPDTNTAAYVLGNSLPGSGSSTFATKVSWYERSGSQNATNEIWYDSNSSSWQYSVGGTGNADQALLPAEQGFIIEIPAGQGQHKLQAIGRVPTNVLVQVIKADAFNLVSFRSPRAVHPSEMNLLGAGFRGGSSVYDVFFGGADTLWKWDRDQQSIPDTGSMIWYDTDSSTWRFSKSPYAAVPAGYFKPDDGIIIYTKGASTDLTWTNTLLYTPPTRLMNP